MELILNDKRCSSQHKVCQRRATKFKYNISPKRRSKI